MSTLTAQAVREHLTTRWLARSLEVLETTDSTNRVAGERAAAGADHGATILADHQSAGRGRHGRSFFSPAGQNIYTSVILRASAGFALAPTCVMAAGLAVAETVAETLGAHDRVTIKWPNDVQVDGLKIAGILLETVGGGAPEVGILGIGINLNGRRAELPQDFRSRATTLATARGNPVERGAFAGQLYGTLERVLDLHASEGFDGIRARLEARLSMLGEFVRVADLAGGVQAEGAVLGVARDGALRLREAPGRERRVHAGDVTVVKDPVA